MRRKSTKLLLVLAVLFTAQTAHGQYYYYDNNYYDNDIIWEIGFSTGLMTGITDIGGKKGFMPNFGSSQLNAGAYAGVMYQNVAGVRLEATWGKIAGADSNGAQTRRNLSFRSSIREIALIGEFHPLMLRYRDQPPQFSPYVAFGMGWFSFNPQANLNGKWIDLQPLRTEGQGFPERPGTRPYRLSQSNIIGGMGVKYELSQWLSLRAEMLLRLTFTDYLDDAHSTYVDPAWFDTNLPAQQATLAKELYDRSKDKDPAFSGPGAVRAGSGTNDHYMTFNPKFAINLGRQRTDY
ncbi:MAG TPA: hypothetical protein VF145_05050 [Chitinophagaceae bacterium]